MWACRLGPSKGLRRGPSERGILKLQTHLLKVNLPLPQGGHSGYIEESLKERSYAFVVGKSQFGKKQHLQSRSMVENILWWGLGVEDL